MTVSALLLKIVTKKSYLYINIAINEIKSRENLKGMLEVIDISEKVAHKSNRGGISSYPSSVRTTPKRVRTAPTTKCLLMSW